MVRCALFASERHPEVRALCAPRRMRGRERGPSPSRLAFRSRLRMTGEIGARSVILRMRGDVTRSHRTVHDGGRCAAFVARGRPESAAIDLSKNRHLASADETQRRFPQKFFYCQKSRLRVREAAVGTHLLASRDVDRAAINDIANNENRCS
jgi:hypothetical protein